MSKRKGALFERMLKKVGKSATEFRSNSRLGRIARRRGVEDHPELHRVAALPRRDWQQVEDLQELQEELTSWLRKPNGRQTFRPLQAVGLCELHDIGGLLGPVTVGGGKTLLTKMAPLIVEAKRPVLLIPGGLREKTHREFAELDEHWQSHPDLKILSYTKLSREGGDEVLFDLKPDFIGCDEVHKLKNREASCTRRVERYMEEHPDTIFMGVSGTITKRSLMDFHHLLLWALGPEMMPLPADRRIAVQWALAVDEKVPMNQRMSAGALRIFVENKTSPSLKEVREGCGKRIRDTPGVVAMLTDDIDASIYLEYWDPTPPLNIREMAEGVSREHRTPDGDIVLDPSEVWRHVKELVCGFYYTWAEEPPKEWMVARRQWRKFVRQILDERRPGLDTEKNVKTACKSGRLKQRKFYDAWQVIGPTYKPKKQAVWVDTTTLEELAKNFDGHELIWVEHREVGKKLSEMTGFPYFNRGGVYKGKPIEDLKGKSAILSIESNKEGRNLQHHWHHNIVVSPPSDGGVWEQLIGRTHRFGQEADEVTLMVMLGHPVLQGCMEQAFADARYHQAMFGGHPKLLLADTSKIYTSKAA